MRRSRSSQGLARRRFFAPAGEPRRKIHSLKIEDAVQVARNRAPFKIHDDAVARILKCRDLLECKIKTREIMYGVNTGIGELSEVVLTPEQVEKFQRYLLYSHAAGCGEPCGE